VYTGGCFFFQAEDGIRYWSVTGVQTCALPILDPLDLELAERLTAQPSIRPVERRRVGRTAALRRAGVLGEVEVGVDRARAPDREIGRASCRERVERAVGGGAGIREGRRQQVGR